MVSLDRLIPDSHPTLLRRPRGALGIGFAALRWLAERRRTLAQLSVPRLALWGLLGSAAIPLIMGTDGSMGALTGALGALFAAGSVVTARRGLPTAPEPSWLIE